MLLYSPAYVVVTAFFITLLSLKISYLRVRHKIPSGDGGNLDLAGARRAHSSVIEFSVVFVPLLICAELMGASNHWIALSSLVFLAGRLIHVTALVNTADFTYARALGTLLSHAAIIALMAKLVFILSTIQ